MNFWASAGSREFPTAETEECYEAVIDALTSHLRALDTFPTRLKEWERRYDQADGDVFRGSLLKQKPKEPTSADLKTLIGQHISQRFPYMQERRHFYHNLLKVPTVIFVTIRCS